MDIELVPSVVNMEGDISYVGDETQDNNVLLLSLSHTGLSFWSSE